MNEPQCVMDAKNFLNSKSAFDANIQNWRNLNCEIMPNHSLVNDIFIVRNPAIINAKCTILGYYINKNDINGVLDIFNINLHQVFINQAFRSFVCGVSQTRLEHDTINALVHKAAEILSADNFHELVVYICNQDGVDENDVFLLVGLCTKKETEYFKQIVNKFNERSRIEFEFFAIGACRQQLENNNIETLVHKAAEILDANSFYELVVYICNQYGVDENDVFFLVGLCTKKETEYFKQIVNKFNERSRIEFQFFALGVCVQNLEPYVINTLIYKAAAILDPQDFYKLVVDICCKTGFSKDDILVSAGAYADENDFDHLLNKFNERSRIEFQFFALDICRQNPESNNIAALIYKAAAILNAEDFHKLIIDICSQIYINKSQVFFSAGACVKQDQVLYFRNLTVDYLIHFTAGILEGNSVAKKEKLEALLMGIADAVFNAVYGRHRCRPEMEELLLNRRKAEEAEQDGAQSGQVRHMFAEEYNAARNSVQNTDLLSKSNIAPSFS